MHSNAAGNVKFADEDWHLAILARHRPKIRALAAFRPPRRRSAAFFAEFKRQSSPWQKRPFIPI
jgi:hypothetical protein